jgi:hypothetical protein
VAAVAVEATNATAFCGDAGNWVKVDATTFSFAVAGTVLAES